MNNANFSKVESVFIDLSAVKNQTTRIPYIIVDNFPKLGFLAALRFLEWVSENPNGVISLPTGKTPEFFIKWTQFLLKNWNNKQGQKIRDDYQLKNLSKPDLRGLQFVQIDEFYPISSKQYNSFYHYVNEYYIKGFGLNKSNSLLINCDDIFLPEHKHFSEIFTNNQVDLSLRYREAKNSYEMLQQHAVFAIDNWCTDYETKIREKGGIGFFLGGIGPDGHIAFNTRGSDHHSTTRLTATNFETQAVAASDLGGIEISKNRLVITIGLETITYNPEAVAIIFAAGEAKAPMVKNALEMEPSNTYPATALGKLKNARFYLTTGAAVMLDDSIDFYYKSGEWTHEKTERALIDLCKKIDKYGHHLTLNDLKNDKYCKLIPNLSEETVRMVENSIIEKLNYGMASQTDQVYLHTGPHHDDIMLGMLPHIHRLLRNESNKAHFSILTSGFTAVTNGFIKDALVDAKKFLEIGLIQMTKYPDFFEVGYKYKWDKDVAHYLDKVAAGEPYERRRGLAHRIVRSIVEIYGSKNVSELKENIDEILVQLQSSYDGEKNSPKIQKLKGMLREFEEELVWAHFGIQVSNVHHLRLGFYTGDVFTEQPNRNRDVEPILELLKKLNPTVVSLAFDPEGSGPDTHYKVLQTIAEALRLWRKEKDISNLKVWGYRNVWYKFHPAEVNVIVPVSLNAMATLETAFSDCYLSQVDASFPSYQLDGKFSDLTKKIWVDQLKLIQLLLGKNYFYLNESPRVRSSHGLLFFKEMTVDKFLTHARDLEKSMEGLEIDK
ncbi:MAG: hypothetical protein AB9846_10170 [Tenuifilaceae bacterium]